MLLFACRFGDLNKVKQIIESEGGKIDEKDNYGNGFMYACKGGHFEIVKYLISKNCKMEEKDRYDRNGFIYACLYGHFVEIVKYLIQHTDCNLQAKDKYGHNAFDIAHKKRKFKIMVYLVKYKIGFNYQFREKLIFDQIFVNTMKREMKNIKSIENFLNKFFIDDEMEQPIKLIINFSYGLENLENFLIYPNKETSQKRKSTFSLGNSKKKQRRI